MKLSEILVRYMEETAQTDNTIKNAERFIKKYCHKIPLDTRKEIVHCIVKFGSPEFEKQLAESTKND